MCTYMAFIQATGHAYQHKLYNYFIYILFWTSIVREREKVGFCGRILEGKLHICCKCTGSAVTIPLKSVILIYIINRKERETERTREDLKSESFLPTYFLISGRRAAFGIEK